MLTNEEFWNRDRLLPDGVDLDDLLPTLLHETVEELEAKAQKQANEIKLLKRKLAETKARVPPTKWVEYKL